VVEKSEKVASSESSRSEIEQISHFLVANPCVLEDEVTGLENRSPSDIFLSERMLSKPHPFSVIISQVSSPS
jgi:hypothetical protein